jgi:hypothetical protein
MGKHFVDEHALKAKAERDWNSQASLREEFSSHEAYLAYLKADASGLVRRFGDQPKTKE